MNNFFKSIIRLAQIFGRLSPIFVGSYTYLHPWFSSHFSSNVSDMRFKLSESALWSRIPWHRQLSISKTWSGVHTHGPGGVGSTSNMPSGPPQPARWGSNCWKLGIGHYQRLSYQATTPLAGRTRQACL